MVLLGTLDVQQIMLWQCLDVVRDIVCMPSNRSVWAPRDCTNKPSRVSSVSRHSLHHKTCLKCSSGGAYWCSIWGGLGHAFRKLGVFSPDKIWLQSAVRFWNKLMEAPVGSLP